MSIPAPAYLLDIGGGADGRMTGFMPESIDKALPEEKADVVPVTGDTNSTLVAAPVPAKPHLPVARRYA